MRQSPSALIGSVIGAFLGYPALGYALGSKLGPTPIPVAYGTGHVGGNVLWATNRIGDDDGKYKRYAPNSPTCPQCGGPHEPHASVCGYCLSPRADAAPADLIEVTALGDRRRRYVPAMQDEYFRK